MQVNEEKAVATITVDAQRGDTGAKHSPPTIDHPHERWNFGVIALYQVILRCGWIFKTESIIMPAVLDSLGGGAWLRGFLPLFNRFGQSIPPLLLSRAVTIAPRKKVVLCAFTLLMGVSFISLGFAWHLGLTPATETTALKVAWWLPAAFLLVYAVFFASTGVNGLSLSTLQGKLTLPHHRGRLMLTSNLVGVVCAVGLAIWLMPKWLGNSPLDYATLFWFAGGSFVVATVVGWMLAEEKDDYARPRRSVSQLFSDAANTIRHDPNFRRLTIAGSLFGCSIMLFPHYQRLAADRLDLVTTGIIDPVQLVTWVALQNVGTGVFSIGLGPLADWKGYRVVLQLLMFGIVTCPLVALGITWAAPTLGVELSRWIFPVVFILVGMTPVTIKSFVNYTLEISAPADHPRYLSTLSLCVALPAVLSPLLGLLLDFVAFEAVFFGVGALVFVGWLQTLWLEEPRHQ
jgi:MFS family permease